MMRRLISLGTAAVIASLGACGSGESAADTERDLALLPIDSTQALSDVPLSDSLAEMEKGRLQTEKAPAQPKSAPTRPTPPPPPPPSLAEGTAVDLVATDSLQLNDDAIGQKVYATAAAPLLDQRGREVIPAGALFSGTVTQAQMTDTSGTSDALVLTFDSVDIAGTSYAVHALTDSIGFRTEKGGITAGDAAKTGAGAVVGAIAGRLIGGNKTGTLVGAAVGTVAGAGVAIATKGQKVMIDAGAPIRIVLVEPFVRRP